MDFQFLQDPVSKKWVSLSPRRAKRPNSAEAIEICPFCPGNEKDQPALYIVESGKGTTGTKGIKGEENPASGTFGTFDTFDTSSTDWLVRVIPNKFPFAAIHELIIHSPDHHKSFGELPLDQGERILSTFRERYREHTEKGQVVIFHNSGEGSGQSLPHPHTQLAVVPSEVMVDVSEYEIADDMFLDADLFRLGVPVAAQWPDEVWFIPKATGKTFGEISDEEIASLAKGLDRLVKIYSHRYGHEFSFNFYIRPGLDWYLRLIPRVKVLGGFEFATGIYVNTHDPRETVGFLREHWDPPSGGQNFKKIKTHHKADYHRHV